VKEPVRRFPEGADINSGALWPCFNGKMRNCWPIIPSGHADQMEHANSTGVKFNACPKRQTPKDQLGLLILPPDLESHLQKSVAFQQNYRGYQNAKTACGHQAMKITEDWFRSIKVRPVPGIFWHLPHV
jgi:hypothetical protein